MHDMLVVELVERVLVDVLDVEPETVLPWAEVAADLGATPADVLLILGRLEPVLPASAVDRLMRGRRGPAGSFTVQELVRLVESRTRYDRPRVRAALAVQAWTGGEKATACA